jgi:hypothetical protein
MDKHEISRKLHIIVFARLFSASLWLADREAAAALQRTLLRMKLEEEVPGINNTWQSTHLGKELRLDLHMVFMGLWDEWEMPLVLEQFSLIDKSQSEDIYDSLGQGIDAESVLRGQVQRVYLEYYKSSVTQH